MIGTTDHQINQSQTDYKQMTSTMNATQTSTATQNLETILSTIDLKEYSAFKGKHVEPETREEEKELEEFEELIGDGFEDTYAGMHLYGYALLGEEAFNKISPNGQLTINTASEGVSLLSGRITLDIEILYSDLYDELGIDLEDWFEGNTYTISNTGIARLQK